MLEISFVKHLSLFCGKSIWILRHIVPECRVTSQSCVDLAWWLSCCGAFCKRDGVRFSQAEEWSRFVVRNTGGRDINRAKFAAGAHSDRDRSFRFSLDAVR